RPLMNQLWGQRAIFFLKTMTLIAAACLGLFFLLWLGVTYEVNRTKAFELPQDPLSLLQKSLLEQDALVKQEHLAFFQPFTLKGGENFKDEWSDLTYGDWIVPETYSLSRPLRNDCERVYCFQYKTDFSQI